MKKILFIISIFFLPCVIFAQQKDASKDENQAQFNLEEFEIIHLSSGIAGETNIKVVSSPQPAQQPRAFSREEREQAIRRLQEIRTSMRKIEDETSQQNPELKAIVDKINELQQKRKALVDEILADNFEYQQLKQKIASGDFQASDTMRLAAIERQAAQDQRIREIDQQIRELQQQRQTLLQTVLKDNQEYQTQIIESQSIMQGFRATFQSSDRPSMGQTSTTGQTPASTESGPRWRRPGDSGSETPSERPVGLPWRGRTGGRN